MTTREDIEAIRKRHEFECSDEFDIAFRANAAPNNRYANAHADRATLLRFIDSATQPEGRSEDDDEDRGGDPSLPQPSSAPAPVDVNQQMLAALKPFAEIADILDPKTINGVTYTWPDDSPVAYFQGQELRAGFFRDARAATLNPAP